MPSNLQTALRVLLAFNRPDAREWKPPYIEVMMWPFSYAKSSMPWPTKFPGISDSNTRHSTRGLEVFVPYSDLDEYKAYVSRLKPTTAVMLDGKKWAISERIPFPHEGKPCADIISAMKSSAILSPNPKFSISKHPRQ
jgi:hypothetical protein